MRQVGGDIPIKKCRECVRLLHLALTWSGTLSFGQEFGFDSRPGQILLSVLPDRRDFSVNSDSAWKYHT
ncbi:hypothetical protein E2C01_098555 [Portunus trituberculatus]|uniref:Uncharacterized protein n=1 Tax=Portunus trituberculatus TaxID=210409 RepID=A0A5B7K7Z2_PORTR|nr:hypothetical protein [Portunus trituberculatus]